MSQTAFDPAIASAGSTSSADKPAARRTIKAIDGLKGVAAIGIVIFHMTAALAHSPELGFTAGWFYKYFILLDLFFVISGYGIASGYAKTFANGVTAQSYGQFLWGRMIRLYPLYIFVLGLLVLQDTINLAALTYGWWDPGYPPFGRETANGWNLLASVFMVQSWGFTYKLVWNIPAWYVSALICAYLAFPFIAWAAARVPAERRGIVLVAIAAPATILLHILFQMHVFPHPNDMSPLRAVLEFTLGYGLAMLKPGPSWRRHLQLPLVALIFVALHLAWRDEITLGILVLFLWTLLDDRGPAAAVLGSGPLVWLGAASYGIFLIHQPVLSLFDGLGNAWFSSQVWILWSENFTWNIALRWVVIITLGWLLQKYIATPAQRWLQGK